MDWFERFVVGRRVVAAVMADDSAATPSKDVPAGDQSLQNCREHYWKYNHDAPAYSAPASSLPLTRPPENSKLIERKLRILFHYHSTLSITSITDNAEHAN